MNSFGPLAGLVLALLLILYKVHPFFSLLLGALAGGLIGGGGFQLTGQAIADGCIGMLPSIACILASGILAGALVQTGSAERIARSVLERLGSRWAIPAVAGAVMVLTACGVFVDIAVITAAPIALHIGSRTGRSRSAILLAMIGGGKAGNILSPNPNTIAAAKAFDLELTSVMAVNLIPAFLSFLAAVWLASRLARNSELDCASEGSCGTLPTLPQAIAGPAAVFGLLLLRPVFGISVDPVFALPAGGAVCMLACRSANRWWEQVRFGLGQVAGVALVLLGTGALSGVIQASNLQLDMAAALDFLHLPAFFLAPLSGILMGGAAASTTAGTAIAAQTFGGVLLGAGIPALSAAAMIHAGATVLDSLPHGSFFHATAGCAGLDLRQRMKLVPLEAAIGLTSTLAAVVQHLIFSRFL